MRLTFAIRVVRVLDRERKEKARKMSSLWCVHLHRSADGSLDSSHRCMFREKATRESFFLLQSQRPSWPDGIVYRYFFFSQKDRFPRIELGLISSMRGSLLDSPFFEYSWKRRIQDTILFSFFLCRYILVSDCRSECFCRWSKYLKQEIGEVIC